MVGEMRFDHSGRRLAIMSDTRLSVLDAATGDGSWHLDASNNHGALAITPDDQLLVAGSTFTSGSLGGMRLLAVHDLQTGELLATLPSWMPDYITTLALAPDGNRLACGLQNGTLLLHDATLPAGIALAEAQAGSRLHGLSLMPVAASQNLTTATEAGTTYDPALASFWRAWWRAWFAADEQIDDVVNPFGYARAQRTLAAQLAWCQREAGRANDPAREWLRTRLDDERVALEELYGMMPAVDDDVFPQAFQPLHEWLHANPEHRQASRVRAILGD